jgi:serine/threonine-protein kinase
MALVVLVTLGGVFVFIDRGADRAADESIRRALDATQTAVGDALASRSRALQRVAAGLAQVPAYVARIDEAIRAEDRAALLDQVDEFREQVGAGWALITDGTGMLQAWTFDRDAFGLDMAQGSLIGLALEGRATTGVWIEPGPDGDLIFQAVGVPIYDPTRSVVHGVLVAAVRVDDAFAAELARNTGSNVAFFVLDTLNRAQVTVATVPVADIRDALAAAEIGEGLTGDSVPTEVIRLETGDEILLGKAGALTTASGFPIGGYIGLRSWNRELAVYTAFQDSLLWVFLAALLVASIAALILAQRITSPLSRLVELTRRVEDGQYSGSIDVGGGNEISRLAASFHHMMRELKAKDELVQFLSQGGHDTVQVDTDGARRQATHSLEVGGTFAGRYRIEDVLGSGGMGIVYRAHDQHLDELVALKILRPDAMAADETSVERFKQEIRLARRITHRHVVRTHDLGEHAGVYFITMEYVGGATLKDLIRRRGKLPVTVTITVGKQLCRALEVAHEQGVIHRDIKPQNVVVDPRGFLKVMDFGIARLAERPRDSGLTAVGTAVGTPDYMAPEQLMGEDVDARVDLYAVGAVLFECLTGRPVFDAPSVPALIAKHLEESPPDPRSVNPDVPAVLAKVVLKALAKKPADRWQSVKELHHELDAARGKLTPDVAA